MLLLKSNLNAEFFKMKKQILFFIVILNFFCRFISAETNTITLSLVSENKAVIQWSTNRDDMQYKFYYNSNPWSLSHNILISDVNEPQAIIEGLEAGRRYYFQIEIIKKNSKVPVKLPVEAAQIKTLSTPDRSLNKYIIEPRIVSIKSNAVLLEYETEKYSTFVIKYGETKRNLDKILKDNLYKKNNKILLKNLEENKVYYFMLFVSDINKYMLDSEKLNNFKTLTKSEISKNQIEESPKLSENNEVFELEFTTSDYCQVVIKYGDNRTELNNILEDKTFEKNHKFIINKPAVPKSIYYSIELLDITGELLKTNISEIQKQEDFSGKTNIRSIKSRKNK